MGPSPDFGRGNGIQIGVVMSNDLDCQMEVLLRGAVDIYREEELRKKLARSLQTGVPLRVKCGFDPTAPDLHIGHTVVMHKMRQFQELGHQVIFLIGDFTGMIGDPTGRSATRKALTREQVLDNAETYKRQVFKVLDPQRTEIAFNSKWMNEMSAVGLIELTAKYTVARMLERDDFSNRYKEGRAISVHEFLYPLVQAYDSCALKADVELGGTDQLFNLLVGRDIMREHGLEPQVVLTTPLLEGTEARMIEGKLVGDKMSKSLGNYVGIDEPPKDMFGKIMSVSDELMWRYYQLLSDLSIGEIEGLRTDVESGKAHPKKVKGNLAKELVTRFHGGVAAKVAEQEFEAVFSRGENPEDIEVAEIEGGGEPVWIVKAIATAELVASGSDGRRMVKQGAVSVDGVKIKELDHPLQPGGEYLVKVGKRRFRKIKII